MVSKVDLAQTILSNRSGPQRSLFVDLEVQGVNDAPTPPGWSLDLT